MALPDLPFLTPILPFPSGTGSAIRAAHEVDALRHRFRVHVLNSGAWGWRRGIFDAAWVKERAASYHALAPENGEIRIAEFLAEHFAGVDIAAIHAFRLITARFAVSAMAALPGAKPFSVLDLDDDEALRAERMSVIRAAAGDVAAAKTERDAIPRLRMVERMFGNRFDVLCLANDIDQRVWQRRYPNQRVVTVPNVIQPPTSLPAPGGGGETPRLLFVGSMDYLPNSDAAEHFVRGILPLIRIRANTEVLLVGPNPPPPVTALAAESGVTVTGAVAEVGPYYRSCDVAIVPLRAGAGTRLKILEAFALGVPVVSTAIGAEGLNVTSGEHLLLADTPEDFAEACVRLLADRDLRCRLRESAWAWLQANHSPQRMREALDSVYPAERYSVVECSQ